MMEQLSHLSTAALSPIIRPNLMAEVELLVMLEYSVVIKQGMILDNFSDYLIEATSWVGVF